MYLHPRSRTRSIPAVLVACAAVVTCREAPPPTGVAIAVEGALLAGAHAAAGKVDMCHVEGNGGWHLVWIAEEAQPAHEAHGDWEVTDEIACDGIDNDCGGWIDEDGGCPRPGSVDCTLLFGGCGDFEGLLEEARQLHTLMNNFQDITTQKPDPSTQEAVRVWNELAAALEAFNAAVKAAWPHMVRDQRDAIVQNYIEIVVLVLGLAKQCTDFFAETTRETCEVERVPTPLAVDMFIKIGDLKGEAQD